MMAAIIALALIAIVLAYTERKVHKAMVLYQIALEVAMRILTDNGIKPDDDTIDAAFNALYGDGREV